MQLSHRRSLIHYLVISAIDRLAAARQRLAQLIRRARRHDLGITCTAFWLRIIRIQRSEVADAEARLEDRMAMLVPQPEEAA